MKKALQGAADLSPMKHVLRSGFTLHYGNNEGRKAPSHELRCAVRFPLSLPMKVVTGGHELRATTCNVSASGVLFETSEAIPVGSLIGFSLRMPSAILGTTRDVLVECSGRVVRCSVSYIQPQVAATIDDYQFVEP